MLSFVRGGNLAVPNQGNKDTPRTSIVSIWLFEEVHYVKPPSFSRNRMFLLRGSYLINICMATLKQSTLSRWKSMQVISWTRCNLLFCLFVLYEQLFFDSERFDRNEWNFDKCQWQLIKNYLSATKPWSFVTFFHSAGEILQWRSSRERSIILGDSMIFFN